jgi:transcriptional regulator with XRE-family HTH domain
VEKRPFSLKNLWRKDCFEGESFTMPLSELEIHPLDEIRPPTDFSPDGLRNWIGHACKVLKITQTELSRVAGIAPSTINKFMLSRPDASKSLNGRTVDAITKAILQIQIDKIGKRQIEALAAPDPKGFTVIPVRVAGSLRSGVFAESHKWAAEELFHVTIPRPNSVQRPLLGFLVEDDQSTIALPYGTIVIGAKVDPETDIAEAGDWFVVTRQNEANQTELTVRQLVVSPKGDMWLTSEQIGPDVYLGKARPDGAAALANTKSEYSLEYRVIVAVRPMTSDYTSVEFHS